MHSKKMLLTNFSRAIHSESVCVRPDNEKQLADYLTLNKPTNILARGTGLSYSDSCLNENGLVIDTKRLNHLIHFDSSSGTVVCQGGTSFKDLFLLDPEFIPPVLPGTVHATVAGGLAHDVHGKNNSLEGSLGHHISWFELLLNDKTIRCSREQHPDLFHATIAGLGLTGIITRVAIRLKKASRFVQVENTVWDSINSLTDQMSTNSTHYDYQVAWLDLLHSSPRALLSTANHCPPIPYKEKKSHTVPRLPFGLIRSWNMKLFNSFYISSKKAREQISLEEFNNPLDKIGRWNRLYGPNGLIQFQAVFDKDNVLDTLEHLLKLIHHHRATPSLAVLKLFGQSGEGLLSFCKPGFTLAIDFIHNEQAKKAIKAMNQWITEINGRIYLAKDLLLIPEQYQKMYINHTRFSQILSDNQCRMQSDLAKRLGIKR
ncbi:L-gulonolactone oxidase [Legionella antarctica]|uniref:L-gulonolactone oxidase n=1 Tax=Legionella antarctica TaxID=2708020 RepID=A0A6F8T7D3_9GAMM|nr:FAD-binding oxidoreductase [Legionella antarctica]BCA95876.1 L-gulonolactone oxidase [Legionella antarctica]